MIQNEERYRDKILTPKEKNAVESGITLGLMALSSGYSFLILGIISLILTFVLGFFNETYSAYTLLASFIFLILSIIFLPLSERDPVSPKALNEKLYIYFDLLQDYIRHNKKMVKIRMINRRLTKYLSQLETHINNVFLYTHSAEEVQVIKTLRETIREDLALLLKNHRPVVIDLIQKIKLAHLSAECIHLAGGTEGTSIQEHQSKIAAVKEALASCKQELSADGKETSLMKKLIALLSRPHALLLIIAVLGVVLLVYINTTPDNAKVLANVSVIGFILSITFFIFQNRK